MAQTISRKTAILQSVAAVSAPDSKSGDAAAGASDDATAAAAEPLSPKSACGQYQDALDTSMKSAFPKPSQYEAFASEIADTAELADEDIAANLRELAYASRHMQSGDPLDNQSRWLNAAERVDDACAMAGAESVLR